MKEYVTHISTVGNSICDLHFPEQQYSGIVKLVKKENKK